MIKHNNDHPYYSHPVSNIDWDNSYYYCNSNSDHTHTQKKVYIYICNDWLVVPTPLKNISQLGMIIPYIIEKYKHVPNHQPDIQILYIY